MHEHNHNKCNWDGKRKQGGKWERTTVIAQRNPIGHRIPRPPKTGRTKTGTEGPSRLALGRDTCTNPSEGDKKRLESNYGKSRTATAGKKQDKFSGPKGQLDGQAGGTKTRVAFAKLEGKPGKMQSESINGGR